MGEFRSDNREGFGDRGRSRSGYGGGRFGGSRFGGRSGGFGGRGGFRDRDSGRSNRRPLEMHEVTCDKCGKRCEVPFRPTGNKPVFCSDCFKKNEDSGSNFGSRNQDRPSQSGMSLEQFNQLNAKLDKILQVLESLELDVEEEYEEEEKENDSK